MSAAPASQNSSTTKATTDDSKPEDVPQQEEKPTQLEEDDEFEDFPVEDWADEDTEAPGADGNAHLWEESWDDDDTSDDFAKMLREELKKVENEK